MATVGALYDAANAAIAKSVNHRNSNFSGSWMTIKPNGDELGLTSVGPWRNFLRKTIEQYEGDPAVTPKQTGEVEDFFAFNDKSLISLRDEIVKKTAL